MEFIVTEISLGSDDSDNPILRIKLEGWREEDRRVTTVLHVPYEHPDYKTLCVGHSVEIARRQPSVCEDGIVGSAEDLSQIDRVETYRSTPDGKGWDLVKVAIEPSVTAASLAPLASAELARLDDEIERLEDESQTAGLVAVQEERNQQIDESVEKFVSTVTGKTTKKKKRRGIK